MTHTEQDKELREKLNSLFESVFSQGVRAGKDVATETYEDFDAWCKKGELEEAMQAIQTLIRTEKLKLLAEVREQTTIFKIKAHDKNGEPHLYEAGRGVTVETLKKMEAELF